ncbi:hypothetical protein ACQBAU_16355 [Propionibacteriaceae bacterium Y2011]
MSAELPVTELPPRWDLATEPGRTVIVATYDDADQTVLWAGWVVSREGGSGPTIKLSIVDMYEWLDRAPRYTDREFTGVEQTQIMRWLGLDLLAATFHGTVVETQTGILRQRTYLGDDDKTRLSAMQQLMSVIDGCEWMISWRWAADGTLVCEPTVAARLGRATLPGHEPFLFSRPEWRTVQDYSSGRGATIVTGVATREGDERVQVTVTAQDLLDAGYLPVEYRWTPDTGSTSEELIGSYVAAKATAVRQGTDTYVLTLHLADTDIVLGRTIGLGDDVQADLANTALPELDRTVRSRLIGWVAEPDPVSGQITRIEPILFGLSDEGGV